MQESNTLSVNMTINQLQRQIFPNNKGQFMKEANILTANVAIKQPHREVLLNTKELEEKVLLGGS